MDKRGFTLIEMLLGIMFSSGVMLLIVMLLTNFQKLEKHELSIYQFDIALEQLRLELTLADAFFEQAGSLCYTKFDSDYCLSFEQNRLVKKSGYEIMMIDLDDYSYQLNDTSLTMTFWSQEKEGGRQLVIDK